MKESHAEDRRDTLDADAFRISEVRLRRAINLNIIFGSMAYVWILLVQGSFFYGFLVDVGATTHQIGLVSTISLACVAVQIPSALLVERLGKRKLYWGITSFCSRFLWVGLALVAFTKGGIGTWKPSAILMIVGASSVLAHASYPVWFAWMSDLIPERRRASFFGRRISICTFFYLIHSVVASLFMDWMPNAAETGDFSGYVAIFSYGAFFGCLDIVLHMFIPDPPMTRVRTGTGLMKQVLRPLKDKQFVLLTIVACLYFFGNQICAPFWIPFFKGEWHMQWFFMVGVMITISSLSSIIGSRVWGYVAGKYGNKPVMILTLIAPMIYWLDWLFISDNPVSMRLPLLPDFVVRNFHIILSINSLLGGFFFSGYMLAQQNMRLGAAPKEGRSVYMAVYSTGVGLVSALGPVLGGHVISWAERVDFSVPLATGGKLTKMHLAMAGTLSVWLVTLILAFRLKESGEKSIGMVLGRITRINPFRLMLRLRTIQHASEPGRKVRAMKGLGRERSRIAMEEIVHSIDDPDQSVREAAVHTLGELGDSDAVEPLHELLKDNEGDVRPAAARALGKIRDAKAASILVEFLSDRDTEVQREVAASLGRHDTREVRDALLALLNSDQPPVVFAAAAQTIGKLGDLRAWETIIGVYVSARNKRYRNRLVVAIADLLGTPGQFYPLLCKDLQKPASAMRNWISQIRRRILRRAAQAMSQELGGLHVRTAANQGDNKYSRTVSSILKCYEEEQIEEAAQLVRTLAREATELVLGQARQAHPKAEGHETVVEKVRLIYATIEKLLAPENAPGRVGVMLCTYLLAQSLRGLGRQSRRK